MRLWIVTTGETLPIDGDNPRLYRSGMLAQYLANVHQHDVIWWSSDFSHHKKKHRFGKNSEVKLSEKLTLSLLYGRGYEKHVSVARLRDHRQVAREFSRVAPMAERPDAIVVSFPTIELCAACSTFGRDNGIPVIMDIRDAWPDIFTAAFPSFLKPIMSFLLFPYEKFSCKTLAKASAIISLTEPFLEWGLKKAGRKKNNFDAVIPMGYSPCLDEMAIETASVEWKQKGFNADAHFIVCLFCTIGRQFDIATIVTAAKVLEDAGHKDIRFVICGEGEGLEEFRQNVANVPSVIFPGWMNGAQIAALMRISRFGIAPYWTSRNFSGNLPNKPVEYISAGLPIITCLEGYLSEFVISRKIGFIYKSGNVESLVKAILSAKAEPSYVEMRTRCLNIFEKSYRAEKVMEDYHGAIKKVVEEFSLRGSGNAIVH